MVLQGEHFTVIEKYHVVELFTETVADT